MKHTLAAVLLFIPALTSVCVAEQLIPAGSVMQCTVSEPKISSKTTHIGDPVLCTLGHVEKYGRSVFPYGSYLVGRFEDYKDPGHLVGKGWMELKFDRLEIPSTETIIPISVRVVSVPKYPVDNDGRIHGNGHPVKDTVEWLIPVLWPIDLINLPRRGPRPVLGPETELTLKVLDDFGVPTPQEETRRPLLQARETQEPAPIERAYAQPQQQAYAAPVQQSYPAPVQQVAYPPMQQAQAAPTTVIYNNYASAPQQQQQAPVVVHSPVQYRYMPPPPQYYRPYGYYPMY